jgi:hypothetical protein
MTGDRPGNWKSRINSLSVLEPLIVKWKQFDGYDSSFRQGEDRSAIFFHLPNCNRVSLVFRALGSVVRG